MDEQSLSATILRRQVGDFINLKSLDVDLKTAMEYIAMMDASGMSNAVLSTQYIERTLQRKDATMVTAIYLYCNWRVWRTYESNERLARTYQAFCDKIDTSIFDEWKNTEQLAYFIRETD